MPEKMSCYLYIQMYYNIAVQDYESCHIFFRKLLYHFINLTNITTIEIITFCPSYMIICQTQDILCAENGNILVIDEVLQSITVL